MAANPVKKAPWKIPFDVNGSGPYVVKIKLSDLLFDKNKYGTPEDPSSWTPWEEGGFRLPHDIILYDPSIFGTDGALIPDAPQRNRQMRGLFLTKVTYDSRANRQFISNPLYRNRIAGDPNTGGYWANDPNAALVPTDEFDYRRRELTFNTYLPPEGSEYYINEDYYTSSCTVSVEGSQQETQTFLVLTNRDDALEATIPGSSVIPYTRIRANANPSLQETYDIIRYFTGYGVGDTGDRSLKSVPGHPPITAVDTLDPTKNVFLQDVEVWLRCAFFADYVDPDSYKQDLHDKSDVQHKNLILGTGDFDRFTRESAEEDPRPYLPKTPPREDFLTAHVHAVGDVGPFPIPTRAGEHDDPIEEANAPIGWLDPDFATLNDAHASALPTSGNIYTSGRVFSPTIDELWIYLKKAVSGRPADPSNPQDSATPHATNSQQENEQDTRLSSEPDFLLGSKLGDPISPDGSAFVNSGEGIRYVMNAGIRRRADMLRSGIETSAYAPYISTDAGEDARAAIGALQTGARWGLREQPFSLRELEAAIKNEAFNAEITFNYITTNFVPTGQLEAVEDGTLHRLHREFVSTNTETSRWVSAAQTHFNEESQYGDSLPGTIENYSATSHIHKGDIYLSAEGRWRYLFDHVRVPVLDEQY